MSEKPYPTMVRAVREFTETFTDAMGVNEVEPTAHDMTDHRRDGNTPIIVLPENLEALTILAMVLFVVLEMMAVVALVIWIVG